MIYLRPHSASRPARRGYVLWPLLGLVLLGLAVAGVWAGYALSRPANVLTVYCAHDIQYAKPVLERFERETGIALEVKYDTEATKSIGLVRQLVQEKDAPRCDVFWNNQLLGTLDLQDRGVLAPYRGAAWKRVPAQYREPEGHWVGFGARLRVYIVNTERVPEPTPEKVEALLASEDLSSVAIAKPIAGTTLTHYSALRHELGHDELVDWHEDLLARGARQVDGNATTKNLVANGACALGFTDTDDAFAALDEDKPVTLLPIELPSGKTIAMPNTVAMIAGTDQPELAGKLIDFLCSPGVEEELAGTARQIPVMAVDPEALPPEVRDLAPAVARGIGLRELLPDRRACLEWLEGLYDG